MDERNQSLRPAHVLAFASIGASLCAPSPLRHSRNAHLLRTTPMPPKHSQPPPRWPAHVQYLTQPRYHLSVPKHIRDLVCASATAQTAHSHTQKPPVAIQTISDPSHPAHGQYGLFATKKIPPRTLILDYIGEVHCDDRPASDYDLSLYRTPDHISVGVDAQHAGNEARFVNDFRGINQKPNVLFQERWTEGGELRMSVWSSNEPIKKGDELLVSYGKSWWRARQGADNVEAGNEGIEGS